jgi:hypothetical protein
MSHCYVFLIVCMAGKVMRQSQIRRISNACAPIFWTTAAYKHRMGVSCMLVFMIAAQRKCCLFHQLSAMMSYFMQTPANTATPDTLYANACQYRHSLQRHLRYMYRARKFLSAQGLSFNDGGMNSCSCCSRYIF